MCGNAHSGRGGQLYVFADGDSAVKSSDGVNVLKMPEHMACFHRCCMW
jgi:hypothetical protein